MSVRLNFRFVLIPALLLAFLPALSRAQCTFTFSPTAGSIPSAGGNFNVTVTASLGTCPRLGPTTNDAWISISFGGPGTGSGSFGYSVQPNPSVSPRTGTIYQGTQAYTVNQFGAQCSFSLSSTSTTIAGTGGNGSFSVTPTANECSWNAATSISWIHITAGTSGIGPGSVGFSVDPNPGTTLRSGTIIAGGTVFTVNETGACVFTLNPASVAAPSTGQAGSIGVNASVSSCAWMVSSQASWIQISFGGNGGTGNGSVGYNVTANTSSAPRSSTITIGGVAVSFSQDGSPCTYSVNPSSFTLGAGAGNDVFSVTATGGCSWQAVSNADWINLSSSSGTGSGQVSFSVPQNTTGQTRTGSISVGGATVAITQTACSILVSPSSLLNLPFSALTGTVVVTAPQGCTWTSVSGMTWLQVKSGASGNGSGSVGYAVDANGGGQLRSGTLTVAGTQIPVSQTSSNCTITVDRPSFPTFGVNGGSGSVKVMTSSTSCTWTPSSNADWIQISSIATSTGNGTVSFSVLPNGSTTKRTGSFSIGSTTVSILQDGQTCSIQISPTSATIPAGGGAGSFDVTSLDVCTWSVASVPWIAITTPGPGAGSGTVSYSVDPNTTTSARTGVIGVSGAAFQITQPGIVCTFSIAPLSAAYPSDGGTGNIAITTPCGWTASTKADWIVLGSASGTGNAILNYTVKPNIATPGRSATLSINDSIFFQVSQSAAGCLYAVSPASATIPGVGGAGSFKVTTTAGCAWTPVSDSPWLKVVAFADVSGNGTVQFSADFSPIGTQRTGTIQVAGQVFTMTQDIGGPAIAAGGVLNAASFGAGPVAPGEIVSIFGQGLGPADPAYLQLSTDGTSITNAIGGTRVLFDGTPAPMTFATANQVNCIVPYSVDGKTTTEVKLEYQGVLSKPVQVSVGAVSPAIFSSGASGSGQGAILNQDYQVNGTANAAARGSVVQIFATGEGQTKPAGVDGKIAVIPLPAPIAAVSVQIGGRDATVYYAGAAPTLVSGVIQINAVVPADIQPGDAVPVVIRIGGVNSPLGVTLAVMK